MAVHELSANNFDQTLASNHLLVIDFWAEWCGPCKQFSKVMSDVAAEYPDVYFASVNVETEKELAEEFAVRSIPFVMIVRDQTVVYAESGALPSKALKELLDQAKAL